MRRSLVIAAACTIAIATLGAGPALAYDRPGTKTAKARSIQLRCRPVAGPSPSVRCDWSAPRREGPFRYDLFRKVLRSEGRPAVVSTGTHREYEDGDVVGGTRYAYKVTAVHENGKSAARSRVVVVRCCDDRSGRSVGEGKPEPTDERGPKPAGRSEPGEGRKPGARPKAGEGRKPGARPKAGEGRKPSARPKAGEGRKPGGERKPAPDQRPAPEASRLALQCRATSQNETRAVACEWAGLPGDKVAGYRLYRKAASGTPMVIATFPGGGTTSFIDDDVAPATTYWYAVEAKSVDGRGTRSNIVEVRCCP